MHVNELPPGRLFTIPGDWREYLVVRHGLCSTTIRTAPGSGREHTGHWVELFDAWRKPA